jgi:hypothetical protein
MSNTPIAISQLGTPVFSNLILNDELSINEVLITVERQKKVVITPIVGREGTVKEFINNGDYHITVNGQIVADFENYFPTNKLKAFNEIVNLESEINVSSAFLNHFNITTVVILNATVSENRAVKNAVPFSMVMVSDIPITLRVNA